LILGGGAIDFENREQRVMLGKQRSMKAPRRHGFLAGMTTGLLLAALAVAAGPLDDAINSGRSFFDQKDYLHAYEQFKIAFELNPQDPGINFYLGRAAFELADYENAYMAFDRVENLNPNFPRVKLELARTYLELGIHDMAKELFTEILATNPPPAVRQNINQWIDRINQARQRHSFTGELSLGLQYDSNARISPSSNIVEMINANGDLFYPAIDPNSAEKADTVNTATLTLNHLYRWLDTPWSWKTTMISYNAFYVQENNFDLNYLGVISGPMLAKDKWAADLLATGNYILKDYQDYLVSGGVMGDYYLTLNPYTMLTSGWKLEARRYLAEPRRDAGNAMFSVGPNFSFGPNKIQLRAGIERENANFDIFSYTKYFTSVRYERRLPWDMNGYASWRYQQAPYDKQDPNFPRERTDRIHEITLGLSKRFAERYTVDFNHTYTNSLSTVELYQYDRHLTALTLSVGF